MLRLLAMCVCMYVCVRMHACMYVCIDVWMDGWMDVYGYVYVSVYVHVFVYVHVHVYVFTMFVCTCRYTFPTSAACKGFRYPRTLPTTPPLQVSLLLSSHQPLAPRPWQGNKNFYKNMTRRSQTRVSSASPPAPPHRRQAARSCRPTRQGCQKGICVRGGRPKAWLEPKGALGPKPDALSNLSFPKGPSPRVLPHGSFSKGPSLRVLVEMHNAYVALRYSLRRRVGQRRGAGATGLGARGAVM